MPAPTSLEELFEMVDAFFVGEEALINAFKQVISDEGFDFDA